MGDPKAGQALGLQDTGDHRLPKIENRKQYVRPSFCGLEKLDFSLRAPSGSLLRATVKRAEVAESRGVSCRYEQSPTIVPLQDLFENSSCSSVASGEMFKAVVP